MDTIEFLRARLDEAQADAERRDFHTGMCLRFLDPGGDCSCDYSAFVLAEVAAKRAVIADYALAHRQRRERPGDMATTGWILGILRVIYMLVQPYRHHPDFDPDWLRPIDRSVAE